MYKKRFRLFLAILFIFIFLFQSQGIKPVYGKTMDTSKIDAVLVLDASGSMKESDPKGISYEAVNMFIDMCSVKGDSIGLIAYTDKIIKQSPLKEIQSYNDKGSIKSILNNVPKESSTDIGLALKSGVNMLDKDHSPSKKPMIVLLSDGKTDLGKNSRTKKESDIDKNEALKIAKDKGYPIYTIGLNADGSVDKNELNEISSSTGGKTFITDTADNLPQILSEIFADSLKLKIVSPGDITANGEYQDVSINIPDSNVMEANISLLSQNKIQVKLIDNNGKERAIPSDNIYYSVSNSYSMIKIINPERGDWTLKVKGISGDKIKVNLIFNYDLKLNMELSKDKDLYKNDSINIISYLTSNGQRIQDKEIYKGTNAYLIVKDLNTKKEDKLDLTNKGESFEGSYKLKEAANYELKVVLEGKNFSKESDAAHIEVLNKDPIDYGKWIIIGIVCIALVILAIILIFIFKKANKHFVGQVMIEIKDINTNKMSPPQYKRLDTYKGKVSLYQLLQLVPEYKEAEKIVFMPGKEDNLIIKNVSDCTVDRSGRAVDASKGYEIRINDRVNITLNNIQKSISIEYFI